MPNRRLALPYLLPYFTFVGVAALPLDAAVSYALRLVVAGGALAWAWRFLGPLTGPRSPLASAAAGVAAGLLGTAVWILLLRPLAGAGGAPWDAPAFWLRLAAAGLLVPVFEEYAMRGFVLRFVVQWRAAGFDAAWEEQSIHDLAPGAWTWLAVLASTAAFALGHAPAEMPASVAYGLLMAGLWVWRKDLLSCVVAHAVTNVALACYVRATDAWQLW